MGTKDGEYRPISRSHHSVTVPARNAPRNTRNLNPHNTQGSLSRSMPGAYPEDALINERQESARRKRGRPRKDEGWMNPGQRQLEVRIIELDSENDELKTEVHNLKVSIARYRSEVRELEEEIAEESATNNDQTFLYYSTIVLDHVKPYAESQNYQYNQNSFPATEQMLRHIIRNATRAEAESREAQALRHQVHALQKQLLAQVNDVKVVSDDQFIQEFRGLTSSIRSFTRALSLKDDFDISMMQDTMKYLELLKDVSPHSWSIPFQKKYLLESWVWSVLPPLVFRNPFSIFEKADGAVQEAWRTIFGSSHCNGWPRPTKESEDWRASTVARLVEDASVEVITKGAAGLMLEGLKRKVMDIRTIGLTVLTSSLQRIASGMQETAAIQIINKACTLAMHMSLQKCRLQVTIPQVGDKFDPEGMSLSPASSVEVMQLGRVGFVIHPGLTKWGDAHGDNFGDRYNMLPALVHAESEQPQHIEDQIMTDANSGIVSVDYQQNGPATAMTKRSDQKSSGMVVIKKEEH